MIYYALLEDGSMINLIKDDFESIKKMLGRNIERGAVLKNGDILKTSAIYYLGSREEDQESPIVDVEDAVIDVIPDVVTVKAVKAAIKEPVKGVEEKKELAQALAKVKAEIKDEQKK